MIGLVARAWSFNDLPASLLPVNEDERRGRAPQGREYPTVKKDNQSGGSSPLDAAGAATTPQLAPAPAALNTNPACRPGYVCRSVLPELPRGWLAACAGLFMAGTADAGRMTLIEGGGPCFAIVEVQNKRGVYNYPETLETDLGPVTLYYQTVGGHNASDHDIITVTGLPPGVAADPMRMELPDDHTGHVCLLQWQGM